MPSRNAHRSFAVTAAALGVALGGGGVAAPAASAAAAQPTTYKHVHVSPPQYGGVIRARVNGKSIGVRLLGIDVPIRSLKHPHTQGECGSVEAAEALAEIVREHPVVTLRVDPSQRRFDKTGRLKAYVEPESGPRTTYQQELLKLGWANTKRTGPLAIRRLEAFETARSVAALSGLGIFTLCDAWFHQPNDLYVD